MGNSTCSVLVPSNTLFGTASADQVRISKADGADGLAGKYKVVINGQSRVMDQAELENTRFELGAGDDTVTIDADVKAKIQLNGGTGTTRVLGNSSNVVDVTGPDKTALPPPFRIRGTPLIVIPLEAARKGESLSLFGMELPFRSATITNESCISQLPAIPHQLNEVPNALEGKTTQPGQPTASVPRFTLTVQTDRARLDVTDKVPLSLHPGVVQGTPLKKGGVDESNVRRNELHYPSLSISDRLYAAGTLSLGDDYPTTYVSPTEVQLTLTSENFKSITPKQNGDRLDFGEIAHIRANALGVGGAKADVRASLDLTRIDAALQTLGLKPGEAKAMRQEVVQLLKAKFEEFAKNPSPMAAITALQPDGDFAKALKQTIDKRLPPGTDPKVVQNAVKNVLAEVTHPGVSIQGPMYMGVPIGYGYFSADTLRHTRAPLEGSGIGTPFPATLVAVGPTRIPAGVITDFATPAGGLTLARDWQSFALSATIAGKPELNPGSIGAGGVAAVRAGFRLGGLDFVVEAGWRGHAALGGKATASNAGAAKDDPVRRDYIGMANARRAAEARFAEDAEKSEAGVFRPDLLPAEVTGTGQPSTELFTGVHVKKTF
jgi:hypothetical protein